MRGRVLCVLPLLALAGCCSDVNCKFAAMTTERVTAFCAPHGGVQSVQWSDYTAICKDGALQAFTVGYYHPSDGAPKP